VDEVQIQSVYQQVWQEKCARLTGLVPSALCEKADLDVSDVVQQYEDDLPSSELVPEEMISWRAHYMTMDRNGQPKSCSRAIK